MFLEEYYAQRTEMKLGSRARNARYFKLGIYAYTVCRSPSIVLDILPIRKPLCTVKEVRINICCILHLSFKLTILIDVYKPLHFAGTLEQSWKRPEGFLSSMLSLNLNLKHRDTS